MVTLLIWIVTVLLAAILADMYIVATANPPETVIWLEGPADTGPVGVPLVLVGPPESSSMINDAEEKSVSAGAVTVIELPWLPDPPPDVPSAPVVLVLKLMV